MELEARGRCQKRSPKGSSYDYSSVSSHLKRLSHQSHSRFSRDRLNEFKDVDSISPRSERGRHPYAAMNAISQDLRRIAWLPFLKEIERIEMSRHFTHPLFTCYNGKMNLMEHVSYFTQLMALYSRNDGCRYCILSLDLRGRHRKFPKNTIFSPWGHGNI